MKAKIFYLKKKTFQYKYTTFSQENINLHYFAGFKKTFISGCPFPTHKPTIKISRFRIFGGNSFIDMYKGHIDTLDDFHD